MEFLGNSSIMDEYKEGFMRNLLRERAYKLEKNREKPIPENDDELDSDSDS